MQPLLYVDRDVCHICEKCRARAACKTRAIVRFESDEFPLIDDRRCLHCLTCVRACPHGAIRVYDPGGRLPTG